ncbi:serine hydroxymethyltransferase [Ferroplasma acidiphilum]|jgi:glycine hydroxymethyltransferase|uniref:Serine hydroxymethyltransferase n=1 Tax=Ferroplasma acidiphilum TaxID=74969 RepID=A0A1V0N5Z3_9ARCH|nr:serine hydroxymethyltransferase [Ferroplasma acidiphilum]ARD85553.1 serine hydroxymethyltransferase [Ferroplasma acidiphilum]MCL4349209.1 serine hydroxymethyltransferase [Candidatus Thermoplasmatota archaeon]NOL59242.1 serine hydroxymethyltransferase [Ferroplasma acidiphilum]WMT52687.1 MAG: serine hydroxymethyltransferase [Ferroplasma acidiphilum]
MLNKSDEFLEDALFIRELAMKHNKFFEESIPLIASENIMSPMAMEMLLTDLGFRYAEGLPHKRYYQGNQIVDIIEDKVTDLGRALFNAKYVDPRPLSGTNSNMAVLYAFTKPGDTITTPALSGGGHISSAPFGAVGFRGLKTLNYPFDVDEMNIDVDGTIKLLKQAKPKLAWFGQSVFLFPTPLKELRDTLEEIGSTVVYDAAHVLGLIGGKQFQDPLREGAQIITGSTHKTLPGPQHGIIIGETTEEKWKKVQRGVFPGTLSNHHLNAMAALGVTLAEHLDYGEAYAKQIIKNAQTLGSELSKLGFNVLGEKNGFTKSHTLAIDVSKNGGGKEVAEKLESCNIILNKNLLPYDDNKKSMNPSGIRIGTQEVTRIGFKEADIKELAELISDIIIKKKDPEVMAEKVRDFKSTFNEVKYCFGKFKPYQYIELFK